MIISKVDYLIREVGNNNYNEYLSSTHWKKVKKVILNRDKFLCRSRNCSNKPSQVAPLGFSLATVFGLSPGNLISLCTNHFDYVNSEEDEASRVNKALYLVSGLRKRRFNSNREIAEFYRKQAANPVNRKIAIEVYKNLDPKMKQQIHNLLYKGHIPKCFIDYLKIDVALVNNWK